MQLLNQLFVNLDSSYRDLKGNLFLDETVNRGSFMNILSVCWGKWKTKESILNAARNFGLTQNELDIDSMDQKAFKESRSNN